MPTPLLFTPIRLRDVTLKNRVVVAPMHQYAAVKGFATDWHLMNAGRFAAGGAGLVIMESTKVERRGCGTVGDTGLWDDAFIPGLARCAAFIRAHGAVPGIQLGHSGRKARRFRPWEGGRPLTPSPEIEDWEAWELVAPSAVQWPEDEPLPRALTRAEIPRVVEAWAEAARRADRAGFDMLEIHGAHGYLIHEFLSPFSNRRTDEYGGSELNRMRFAIEVVEAVRAVWPPGKPLFLRLSCEDDAGWDLAQSIRLARLVGPKGVDVIDCSSGGMRGAPVVSAGPVGYGYQVPYAEAIRREAGIMTMAVGLIVHADQAEAILEEGRADLVALARELLYNPNWPMDAARKLGVEGAFDTVPPPQAYWLAKRASSVRGVVPSTYGPGLEAARRAAAPGA
ncbi:NADH:flavin oxidoreductase/NADH oxidase [Caldovatus aquaticus]|uniref:NADH:flavin oxidoreductase/NADH oxidase n=1 Tax=Caldovatus aquaticus TaxID=2865671 RepID=A0ABS7F3N3_9PROT|nr:NADH:flavin oxidoreductase/NADH oxidase [Caldovatus aquaticus]MBW8269410.1 NADH:flavin oxidoreductase/NADH oxidase [Caldovatus aquaticus]